MGEEFYEDPRVVEFAAHMEILRDKGINKCARIADFELMKSTISHRVLWFWMLKVGQCGIEYGLPVHLLSASTAVKPQAYFSMI